MSERTPKPSQRHEPTGSQHRSLIPDNQRPHLTIEQASTQPGRPGTQIEVFTGAIRMTGAHFRIEVAGSGFTHQATGDRTVFTGTAPDGERLLFGVRSDGAVLFRADPQDTQAPQTAKPTSDSGEGLRPPASPGVEPHTVPDSPPVSRSRNQTNESGDQHPSTPAAATTETSEPGQAEPITETEQAERVQLTGRLGRNPSFHTTTDGVVIGKFPLAVHHEDGTTSWHTVKAFRQRAEQLRQRVESGELTQGREVDVVGYLHTTEQPGKNGRPPRRVQEVFAVAVRKR